MSINFQLPLTLGVLRVREGRMVVQGELMRMPHSVSSFGQDEAGELYLADHSAGYILKLVPK